MTLEQFFQYVLSGITIGSIYVIVAIGFNIIYNTTGIINFAQGEFVMLGGMTAISLTSFFPLTISIILAVLITSIVGAFIDIIFVRRLKMPTVLNMIIVTIGLSIIIREIALHIWDEKVRSLSYFTGNEVSSINIFGAFISPQVLWVLGISSMIVIFLGLFFITMGSIWCFIVALFSAQISGLIKKNKRITAALEKITGIIYIGLGLNLLKDRS